MKMPASQKNTTAAAVGRSKQASGSNASGGNALPTAQKKALGAHMNQLNQSSTGARQPQHKVVKTCIDKAVQQVFPGGHANVQSQGSAAKGTSLSKSDRDFFVRPDNTIPTVTKNQRIEVRDSLVQQLGQKGIKYGLARLGQNRIHLSQGSRNEPDVDVVFQRFKSDVRKEPDNRAMAGSHVGQQVAKHMKGMPEVYTNLPAPKQSSLVERHVKLTEDELHCQRGLGKLQGTIGFGQLLKASLEKLGGRQELTQQQRKNLEQAGMAGNGWDHAAKRDLNKLGLS